MPQIEEKILFFLVWNYLLLSLEVFLLSLAATVLLRPENNAVFDLHPKWKQKKEENQEYKMDEFVTC